MKKSVHRWVHFQEAGKIFNLSDAEFDDLKKVMIEFDHLFCDIALAKQLGFKMRSESHLEFFAEDISDVEYGNTYVQIEALVDGMDGYESLEFPISIEALNLASLSHSDDFPHNLSVYLAGEVNDRYLAYDDTPEDERIFARKVFDALNALAEKNMFEKKFGDLSTSKKFTL